MPSTPTVSRCAHSISVRPRASRLRTTTLGRPGVASSHSAASPFSSAHAADEARDLRLAGAAGHQRGVDGVDGDQPPGELDDVHAA